MSTESVSFTTTPTGSEAPPVKADDPLKKAGEGEANKAASDSTPATPEALAKSNSDMRAEITRLQQELAGLKKSEPAKTEDKPADNQEKKSDETLTPDQKAAADAVAKAGVDVSKFQTEFDANGDISPENRDALAKLFEGTLGKDARQYVDAFIEGQKNLKTNYETEVKSYAGGAEKYDAIATWAKANLSPEQKAAYSKSVTSGDLNAARLAVEGLTALYTKANGKEPNLVAGNEQPGVSGTFASVYEMTKAMSDPRYEKDPVYRKSVEQKVARSKIF